MKDLRTWLTVYSYWNQGGLDNVVSMFLYLAREAFGVVGGEAGAAVEPKAVIETPATGGASLWVAIVRALLNVAGQQARFECWRLA